MYIKEACVETMEQALTAERLGADRLELCARLDLDGLTPDRKIIVMVKEKLSIPIRVMIRPRAGGFIYNQQELASMMEAIDYCKSVKVEGVVFGVLTSNDEVDITLTQQLISQARPLKTTFHRAIETVENMLQETRRLILETTIDSILTSGGKATPLESENTLRDLIHICRERELIVCGKITNRNLPAIDAKIGSRAYHGKRIVGDLV